MTSGTLQVLLLFPSANNSAWCMMGARETPMNINEFRISGNVKSGVSLSMRIVLYTSVWCVFRHLLLEEWGPLFGC